MIIKLNLPKKMQKNLIQTDYEKEQLASLRIMKMHVNYLELILRLQERV